MEAKDNHPREKSPLLNKVANVEKQFLVMIHAETLWHSDVQLLYREVCSCYEETVLGGDHRLEELQDVEYSLWKLHYRVIDEFRKRMRQVPDNVEGFKSFLSEASGFYLNLIVKARKCYGLGQVFSLGSRNGADSVEPKRMQKLQFLWHRFLVCLGDLARYNEQCEKPGRQNWSVPASHYSEAATVWPHNGNPHNQLAVLATYVGDEFLALYHCIRSLAVKEPFPDAWNNLLLLCEKNRSSSLPFVSDDVGVNFLEPSSSVWKNEQQQNDESSGASLWVLMIRVVSFFFLDSSFEEFPSTFASAVKELEVLLSMDDTKVKAAMESHQHTDSAKRGPLRTLQVVCVLIFVVDHLRNNSKEVKGSMQWALTATFIVMGRLVDRCAKANPLSSCILLPALLVFMEWLLTVFDEVEAQASSDDRATSAMSYFFSSLSELLTHFDGSESPVTRPLWEDHELRGFAPLALPHAALDFSTHHGQVDSFERGKGCRVRRIIDAGKRITDRKSSTHHGNGKKSDALEEEEVILFKPLTRHNSAPIYNYSFDNNMASSSSSREAGTNPADECLRRATSLLIAQNQGDNGGFAFHSGLTNFRRGKQQEQQPLNGTLTSLFSEPTISPPFGSGPPSLSAWVSPSSSQGKSGTMVKHTLPPIDEAAASSMSELTISEPYSPPLPSAPLLPDDAPWANENGDNIPVPRFLDHEYRPSGISNWGLADGYTSYAPHQPRRMTASEWLRQYRENQSRRRQEQPGLSWQPSHHHHANHVPPSMPPMIRGYYDEGSKQQSSYWDGSLSEPEPLLQYLKEKEWLLHHQQGSSFRGPTFMGS